MLRDTGTLELRDAVLAWDEIVHRPERDRPDPTPRLIHPVTGERVPDPEAVLPYMEYVGARPAEWPQADFIVGNPPYMGGTRTREAFGDGYVDGLRAAYPEMREGADFVMYWWAHAAAEVAGGRTVRAGLITTNSITQTRNRTVVEAGTASDAAVLWAVADHPWVDETGSAAVRVAMTVIGRDNGSATLVAVDESAAVVHERTVPRLNSDLSALVDVAAATAVPLEADEGMSFLGFLLNGPGFIVTAEEAERLCTADVRNREIIKPYVNGRDLARRPRGAFVIDFGIRDLEEARTYPLLYNIVVDRVKPRRDANKDRGIRENWWRFHRIRHELRFALEGLPRFICTPETIKQRYFLFLDQATAPDHSLVCITSSEGFHLGVLSSEIHVTWALAAGGRLGIGNDPRYNKRVCFDPFPFPDPTRIQRGAIADLAEALDAHRKEALARDERVTMTGMYNVLEKLRSGEPLTPKERTVHELAACGVLRELHDGLDELVAAAYGWPWPLSREEILDRLVALHDERAAEEERGLVRWLRPEYQRPKFGGSEQEEMLPAAAPAPPAAEPEEEKEWPGGVIEQLTALQTLLGTAAVTAEEAAARFRGAPVEAVRQQLELLAGAGEAWRDAEGRYRRAG